MDKNLLIQYTVVGILIAAACVWVIVKSVKRAQGKSSGCCGCALADACNKKKPKKPAACPGASSEQPKKADARPKEPCPHCRRDD